MKLPQQLVTGAILRGPIAPRCNATIENTLRLRRRRRTTLGSSLREPDRSHSKDARKDKNSLQIYIHSQHAIFLFSHIWRRTMSGELLDQSWPQLPRSVRNLAPASSPLARRRVCFEREDCEIETSSRRDSSRQAYQLRLAVRCRSLNKSPETCWADERVSHHSLRWRA